MTAGDLIRAELAAGISELGLAKQIVGRTNDADPEVKRWRFIVRRAGLGAEPNPENAKRISDAFGRETQSAPARQGRLAKLEESVASVLEGQHDALDGQEKILGELSALREMLDARLPKRQGRGQTGAT